MSVDYSRLFQVYPKELADFPTFEDEDGSWWGYGHVPLLDMTLAVIDIMDFENRVAESKTVNPEDVHYQYAKLFSVNDTTVFDIDSISPLDDEVRFIVCDKDDEGSFPVTLWNY